MKILHVISTANPAGGGPIEGVRQLYPWLVRMGHEVELVSCDAPDVRWVRTQSGLRIHALGPSYLTYAYTPRLLPWLLANARTYDVLVVNGLWQYTGYAVYRSALTTHVPYFVFSHGMLDPWFKKTYPIKHLKKMIYWQFFERHVLRSADALISTCEDERILARQSFSPYQVREAVTTYGTTDPPDDGQALRVKFLNMHPQLLGKRVILYLSRIHPKKGVDILIRAFSRVASVDGRLHLLVAGPDQVGLRAQLKALARSLGIGDRITWLDMVQGDEKWGAYYSAEAFCLPSHQENFGIVVAEALACGVPVLISDKVNIWREIVESGAGLVASDSVEGTENNLRKWLCMSEPERREMIARTKICFQEKFHIRGAAARLFEILSAAITRST